MALIEMSRAKRIVIIVIGGLIILSLLLADLVDIRQSGPDGAIEAPGDESATPLDTPP